MHESSCNSSFFFISFLYMPTIIETTAMSSFKIPAYAPQTILYIIQQGLTKREITLTCKSFFILSATVERQPARTARSEYISVKVSAPATSICPRKIARQVPSPILRNLFPKEKIRVRIKAMRSRAAPAYAPRRNNWRADRSDALIWKTISHILFFC